MCIILMLDLLTQLGRYDTSGHLQCPITTVGRGKQQCALAGRYYRQRSPMIGDSSWPRSAPHKCP